MKSFLIKVLPWICTAVGLYFAFRGIQWSELMSHARLANPWLIAVAIVLTLISYVVRSRRWQELFPNPNISFFDSFKVLILGFFMNNILPARTGELVRAHAGAKITKESRTLVLATIVSERIADGLTLSLFFILFAFHAGDAQLSQNLFYVAVLFALVACGALAVLLLQAQVIGAAEKIHSKVNSKATGYALTRLQTFIDGLAPLFTFKKLPKLIMWSLIVWSVELSVYFVISQAFHASLSLPACTLFMVATNFSSLIPAAPGGIGVIEAVTTAALVSIGVEREHALSMVLTQHVIQYLVVGVPGALVLLRWNESIKELQEVDEINDQTAGIERSNP